MPAISLHAKKQGVCTGVKSTFRKQEFLNEPDATFCYDWLLIPYATEKPTAL